MGDWFNVVALFSLLLELTGTGESIALVLYLLFIRRPDQVWNSRWSITLGVRPRGR